MYHRPGIVALARSIDDAPIGWRWAWEGLVGAYVPALSHMPVGGFDPPRLYQPAASKMPDGAYMQDSTGGAGFVCQITPAGKAALLRYGTQEYTIGGSARVYAAPNDNQYLFALVDNNADASPYITAGAYLSSGGTIWMGHTEFTGGFNSALGGNNAIRFNTVENAMFVKSGSGGAAAYYRDGVLFDGTYNFAVVGTLNNITATGGICVGSGGVNGRTLPADLFSSAIWGRAFSARDAATLSADPIAMFRWQRRRSYVFYAAAGGTSVALAGTARL